MVSVDEQGILDRQRRTAERRRRAPGSRPTTAKAVCSGDARDANGNLSLTLGNGEVITLPIQQVLNLTLSTAINTTVVDTSAPMTVKYTLHGEHAADALVGTPQPRASKPRSTRSSSRSSPRSRQDSARDT